MAVRLPIEINVSSVKANASALANSGYETIEPEILVPLSFAKNNLGLSTEDGKKVAYQAAAHKEVQFYFIEKKVKIKVVTKDKQSVYIDAILLISETEDQVVLNDKLVGRLGIDLVNVAEGIWRFTDDPSDISRKSSDTQLFT
ncbi:MAG: hypothetical protein FVQ77_12575 [Cytophagales bacterium]|nr:hypothetical protein [Cytophagales bacterium]